MIWYDAVLQILWSELLYALIDSNGLLFWLENDITDKLEENVPQGHMDHW